MKEIGLLFDCLRSPYDVAHIYQVAASLGNCNLYLSGNSIDTNNCKIKNKVKSWRIENIPIFKKFDSLGSAVNLLHNEGKCLIGTSPTATKSVYDYDFTKQDSVVVFGTEFSGLTEKKSILLDDLVRIPMSSDCKFLTLTTAVPIIAYEFYRQTMEENHEFSK